MKQSVRVGIDLVDILRIEKLFLKHDARTLSYLFTTAEQVHCQQNSPHYYALSFSAKESVGKALGVGLAGLNGYDIQVFPKADLTLQTLLSGDALKQAKQLAIIDWYGCWCFLNQTICVTTMVGRC